MPDGEVTVIVRRPFSSVIAELADGAVDRELADKLTEVLAAVKLVRKQGSVSVKLIIKPLSKGGAECVVITDETRTVIPEFDPPATIFYIDDRNQLDRNDPRQANIQYEGNANE